MSNLGVLSDANFEFTVNINECNVISVWTPEIDEVKIQSGGKKTEQIFDGFVAYGAQTCSFIWNYYAYLGDELI